MPGPLVFDTPYVPLVEPAQTPAWLDHVLRYHGVRPPRRETGAYRYLDLGCGFGLTLLYLAAAHPAAAFVGVDANRGHVDRAREIASRAGLSNAVFHCRRFGAPELREIEPVDYAVSNGVLTWLPEPVRELLIDHYRDLVAPGGAALVGYNLMRGWLPILPMQRLLAQLHKDAGETDLSGSLQRGRALVAAIAESTNASIFRFGAERFEELMSDADERYFVHEFLAPGWMPVWTADLIAQMARAQCRYLGDTDLEYLRDDHALTAAQRALLAEADSAEMAWLLRDMFQPRRYARGLFHKPGDAAEGEAPTRLAGWVRLSRAADRVDFECRTPAGRLGFDSPLARELVDWLAGDPRDLAELTPGVQDRETLLATLDALCASQQVVPCDPPQPGNRVERLNEVIAELGIEVAYRADVHATPVRLGAAR